MLVALSGGCVIFDFSPNVATHNKNVTTHIQVKWSRSGSTCSMCMRLAVWILNERFLIESILIYFLWIPILTQLITCTLRRFYSLVSIRRTRALSQTTEFYLDDILAVGHRWRLIKSPASSLAKELSGKRRKRQTGGKNKTLLIKITKFEALFPFWSGRK